MPRTAGPSQMDSVTETLIMGHDHFLIPAQVGAPRQSSLSRSRSSLEHLLVGISLRRSSDFVFNPAAMYMWAILLEDGLDRYYH